jgi:hypothetical protein
MRDTNERDIGIWGGDRREFEKMEKRERTQRMLARLRLSLMNGMNANGD